MQATSGNRFEINELKSNALFKKRRFSFTSQETEIGHDEEDEEQSSNMLSANSLSPKQASALLSKSESSIRVMAMMENACAAVPSQESDSEDTLGSGESEGEGSFTESSSAASGPEQKDAVQVDLVKKKKKKGFLNLKGRLERMSISSKTSKKDLTAYKTKQDDKDKKDGDTNGNPSSELKLSAGQSPVSSPLRTSFDNMVKPSPISRKRLNSSPQTNSSNVRTTKSNSFTNTSMGRSSSDPVSLVLRSSLEGSPSSSPVASPALNGFLDISEERELNASDEIRRSKNLEKFFGDAPQPSRKFEKILGDSPTTVFDRSTAQEFEDDEEAVDIQEEGVLYCPRKKKGTAPIIKGATLHKLIEKLTHHAESDPNFQNQFLYTYRLFTSPQELLGLLKKRFENIEAGIGEELTTSTKNKQVVRLRVFNVLKSWLQHHWVDFQDDPELVDSVMGFTDILARDMNMAAKSTIVRILTKNKGGEQERKLVFSKAPPEPHLFTCPKEKLSLLEIHPEEFARQITLLEHEAYKAIKPWEFLLHTRGQKKSTAILAMINRFNDVSHWVQSEILRAGETPKQRAAVFSRLLEICIYLKELNNYNALMEIISGMNASAIFRLKLTWAALPSKMQETFGELNTLMSANAAYKNLRTTLRTIGPPCIPYMGMYLTDLTFIYDGNNPFLDNGYINFDKCRRLSAVIQEVVQYQQTPYCLKSVPEIQDFFRTLDFEKEDDNLYKLSLYLEERGSVRL